MLSPLENHHPKPGSVLLRFFVVFGAACTSKASASAYGGEGRGKPRDLGERCYTAGREASRRNGHRRASEDGIEIGFFS